MHLTFHLLSNIHNKACHISIAGKYNEAIDLLTKVFEKDPEHVVALQNASRIQTGLGRVKDATELYNRYGTPLCMTVRFK